MDLEMRRLEDLTLAPNRKAVLSQRWTLSLAAAVANPARSALLQAGPGGFELDAELTGDAVGTEINVRLPVGPGDGAVESEFAIGGRW